MPGLARSTTSQATTVRSLHGLGIVCALAAGAWLGGAEAPTKLVAAGFSPFSISLCMVLGVFVARWTLPIAFKGTNYVFRDLRQKPHLIVWAVLAGALWAVANTLTVFAIRDVGLSIAFPLWNTNCLVGLFWGWFFFHELKGAGAATWTKVLGGAIAIVASAVMLSAASIHSGSISSARAVSGVVAALGAGLMWGTMYVPYRKAYLSGMNPLSFVTVFTFGELGTMGTLAVVLHSSGTSLAVELHALRPSMLWLFLGGFCWVIGDLFQQYATKYIGIGRAIPLSNTNQLWGLAWGAFVFGEFAHASASMRALVFGASIIMILGALAISSASAPAREQDSCMRAITRECERYRLNVSDIIQAYEGREPQPTPKRPWWDFVILAAAVAIFAWLASYVRKPPIAMNAVAALALTAILIAVLLGCGWMLWKKTRFS
ncbi:MAG: GRP family sugar transporter [Acidobacteriaceae bacterium]